MSKRLSPQLFKEREKENKELALLERAIRRSLDNEKFMCVVYIVGQLQHTI